MIGAERRLRELLGGAHTAWIVQRVRARLEQGEVGPLAGWIGLRSPTSDQRHAVTRLLGPPRRVGKTLRVDLERLEHVLRAGPWPAGLEDAVVTLTGPVQVRSVEADARARRWATAAAAFGPAIERHPQLQGWWEQWCARGNLRRAATAEGRRRRLEPGDEMAARTAQELAAAAARVAAQLPVSGEPVAVLARRLLGDAHALDDARPLGRLLIAVVQALADDQALGSREAWAAAGVLLSEVSATVACLGVPGATGEIDPAAAATSTALEAWRAVHAPVVLTLAQVRSGGVGVLPPDSTVHVCENPSVVEVVAERMRAIAPAICPPLVCTSGMPGTAAVELLTRLSSGGAQVRYHGDFDWAGLRIACALADRVPWQPWRFGVDDYLQLARSSPRSLPLRGTAAESPWDPPLAAAMATAGLAVEEEAAVEELASDLVAHDAARNDERAAAYLPRRRDQLGRS